MGQFSVLTEQKKIVGNVNLASNLDYYHGGIIRIYMV